MRAIPDDNLAYPVHIIITTGDRQRTGSGFYLNTGKTLYLVTAAHVISNTPAGEARIESPSMNPSDSGKNVFVLNLQTLSKDGNILFHKTEDVVVIRVAHLKSENGQLRVGTISGVENKENTISGIVGVPLKNVKMYKDVLISNEVYIFGYPESIGIKEMPQLDHTRPLLRKGVVAGNNPSKKSLVLDVPVYPGNSGGPVLEVVDKGLERNYKVIGLVTEFIPFAEKWINTVHGYSNTTITNPGYSVAVPIDFVLELAPAD